jgi:hypothetical protein
MPNSFRKVLVDSHTAAITVAILLFVALDNLVGAMREPAYRAVLFLVTAAGERDLPYIPLKLDTETSLMILIRAVDLLHAIVAILGAWLLSHWAYGTSPLRCFATYHNKSVGDSHA